ncbi:MAG: DUF935 family protein [Bacteroidales bacterium]|nr:DUF935 family protein [Bacteroidales bacterium]
MANKRGRPAAKKTITQTGVTGIFPGQGNPSIILQSPELFHFDIAKYRSALESAEAIDFHNRSELYDIYHSILQMDGHLSGIVEKRLSAVSRERFEFLRDGKPVDEVNRQIRSPWFRSWVKDAVASKLWGFSLFQFRRDEKGWITYELVDRKHFDPTTREVLLYETDVNGAPLDVFENCLLVCDDPRGLGKLANCAPYALYKRGNLGDWAQFCQIFGMPIREYTYSAGDEDARKRLLADARKQGANAVYIHPEGSSMTLHEAAGKSGTVDLYERFLDNCNDEMSISVLGNTLTTKSENNGTQALGTVQAKEQLKITDDDVQFILDLLNYDMTDIFAALGVSTENGEFVRVEQKYQDKQVQINVVSKLREMGLPMSDDYLYETFDVAKPDDYDARKAAIDAEREAAAEQRRILAQRLNEGARETRQEPTSEERRTFYDRFRSFFGLAPRDGASGDPLPF